MPIINFTFKPEHKTTKDQQEWLNEVREKSNKMIDQEIFNLHVFGNSDIFDLTLTIKEDNKKFNS
jgi:hypothetical protein